MPVSGWADRLAPRVVLLPDQISLLAHLSPSGLAFTSAKTFWSLFFMRVNVVHKKLADMTEEEQDEVDLRDVFYPSRSQHPLNYWTDLWPKFKAGVFREVTITTTLRLFEHVAAWELPYRPARQLIKNTWMSAMRKSSRYASKELVAQKVFPMAVKSQTLYWLATYTVLVCMDAYSQKDFQKFLAYSRKTLFKCMASSVMAGVGAVIGTWLRPHTGTGAQLGVILAPQIVWIMFP